MMLECTQKPMVNQNNVLKLVLTHKWYDMIEAGVKTEEYRELSPHWAKRFGTPISWAMEAYVQPDFCDTDGVGYKLSGNKYTHVQFQRAYPKNPPRMTKAIKSIRIGTGKPEWGAEPNKLYFVIELI